MDFAKKLCIVPIFIMSMGLLEISSFSTAQATGDVERWGVFELTLIGPSSGNPYVDVQWSATFTQGSQSIKVAGFWDSGSTYKLRFSPPTTGTWSYQTSSTVADLNGKTGSLQVTEATGDNHGPVQVCDTFYLRYADSTRYHQWGTTCYAWVHQPDSLQELTLKTLATSPFNKIRMTVFPKDYTYNHNDPPYYAFLQKAGTPAGQYNFDYTKINPVFWQHFEKRILDLQKLNIEADIILFHPYDRWGFKNMGAINDNRYLRYCIARFGAYRNVWWSLANEWQFCSPEKHDTDFVRFANIVMKEDPHHRMCSIHDCDYCYWAPLPAALDYSMPYFTHAGIQGACESNGLTYRSKWKKPLIWDESVYEGNIPGLGFANLTAQQMSKRFWDATFYGTYQGHSECILDTGVNSNDQTAVLWWGKGGTLKGQSPKRIQWFNDSILAKAPPFNELKPQSPNSNISILSKQGKYYLVYCRNTNSNTITLSGTLSYKVDRLDPDAMTATTVGTGTTSPGSYTFTSPKADVIYRFVSLDYVPIETNYNRSLSGDETMPRLTVNCNAGQARSPVRVMYQVPNACQVTLAFYDMRGRLKTMLEDGSVTGGSHSVMLMGAELTSGCYLLKLTVKGSEQGLQTIVMPFLR